MGSWKDWVTPGDAYVISLYSVLISSKQSSRYVYGNDGQLGSFGGFQGDPMVHTRYHLAL